MEVEDAGLIKEAFYRAAVAAQLRRIRPDSRAAAQQSALAGEKLTEWMMLRERDLSEMTGRGAAREAQTG